MTGLLALFSLALTAASFLALLWSFAIFFRPPRAQVWRSSGSGTIQLLVLVSVIVLAPFLVLCIVLGVPFWRFVVLYIWGAWLGTPVALVMFGGRQLRASVDRRLEAMSSHSRKQSALRNLATICLALLIAAAAFGWIDQFAKGVFNRVDEQFGGARARRVRLLLEADAVDRAKAVGIEVGDGELTAVVILMFQGSELYVVRLAHLEEFQYDQPTIVLSRDEVRGLVVNPEKDRPSDETPAA